MNPLWYLTIIVFLLFPPWALGITIEDLSKKLSPDEIAALRLQPEPIEISNSRRGIIAAIYDTRQFIVFIRDIYYPGMDDNDGLVYLITHRRGTDSTGQLLTLLDSLSLDPLTNGIVFDQGIPLFSDIDMGKNSAAFVDIVRKHGKENLIFIGIDVWKLKISGIYDKDGLLI
jgi:hypothetical protein